MLIKFTIIKKKTSEKTEGEIKNRQSRDTGNIGHTMTQDK